MYLSHTVRGQASQMDVNMLSCKKAFKADFNDTAQITLEMVAILLCHKVSDRKIRFALYLFALW